MQRRLLPVLLVSQKSVGSRFRGAAEALGQGEARSHPAAVLPVPKGCRGLCGLLWGLL